MADEALALLSALVLEDDRRWGEAATDWQRDDAAAVLSVDGPRFHFQTRPRGGSKTTDLAGVCLAVLLEQAPAGTRSYAVAVDGDQAALLHDAMVGLVARTPGLKGEVKIMQRQVISVRTGASIEVLPADGASAWGLRPYFVVVDEMAQWPSTRNHRELWTAIVSAMPKTGGRLVCLTSAGDPGHWSFRHLQAAKESPAWRVSEVPGPLPWRSEEDLAEQRRLLPESSFARLHLNQWTAAEDRLTTIDDVRACVGHSGVIPPDPRWRYQLALDVGLVNDRTVCAVGHLEPVDDGSRVVVVDRIDVWQGRKGAPVDLVQIEEHMAAMSATYRDAPAIVDPYQAVHLAQGLRRRGVRVTEFTFSAGSTGRLGLLLYRLLRDHLLDLPEDEELVDELANVHLRETSPGSYRLDHEAGKHDDRAVTLALLSHALLEVPRRRRRGIVASGMSDPVTVRVPL